MLHLRGIIKPSSANLSSESCLEGVNRRKPEIYKLKHTLKARVSVRIKFKSERLFLLLGVA
jgi:hypothetical protein